MDNSTVLVLVIAALIVLAAVFSFATARRRDERNALGDPSRGDSGVTAPGGPGAPPTGSNLPVAAADVAPPTGSGRELERSVAMERRGGGAVPDPSVPPPAPVVIPDEEALGVTRRQVLNRGIVTTMTLAITAFGGACLSMLWPSLTGGFGSKIKVGKFDEIMEQIAEKKEPFYYAAGRFYITPYPKSATGAAKSITAYSAVLEGYEQGVTALYQKCVHLGCRVPWCKTSQWFECPCHGSQYNRVGEHKGGPAPRGLDRFIANVEGGSIVVDTKLVIPGPPVGTNTTGQESEGPHCIGAVGGH